MSTFNCLHELPNLKNMVKKKIKITITPEILLLEPSNNSRKIKELQNAVFLPNCAANYFFIH